MKTQLSPVQKIGLALLPMTMAIYHFVPESNSSLEGMALINYGIAALYFFISFGDWPKKTNLFRLVRPRINWHILMAILLVSCFSLNKDVHVFALTPLWLEVLLILVLFAFVFIAVNEQLPLWLSNSLSFITGIGILVLLYYTIVLLPTIPIAIIGLILLGLSIHLVVPFIMLVMLIQCVRKQSCINVRPKFVMTGLLSAVLILMTYTGLYAYHSNKILSAQEDIVLNEESELPEWVLYAQKCHSSFWAKRTLGLGLLYDKHTSDWWGFDFNRGSFSEIREHDPLLATAALRQGTIELSNEEKVKILSASANTRHYAYEKLWSGRDLKVSKALTDVRLYPAYRLAYFEKTFWIENNNKWERNQQEALFTFYLPEGAVASSLSLWIDGKEEKSRLTTRRKAATAYKQIVGVEQRDPVVLHWQEGNRLTATIFPCTSSEARRVMIGITSPMKQKGGYLYFEPMQVSGPDNTGAKEVIHLKVIGDTQQVHLPRSFDKKARNQYLYNGSLFDNWQARLRLIPLSEKSFAFKGKEYRVEALVSDRYFDPSVVYLDVNREWTQDEMEQMFIKAGDRPVYVYTNELMKVDLSNMDELYQQLSEKAFSLFPVHKITDVDSALLITKGQKNSPVPTELEGSAFYNGLIKSFSNYRKPLSCLLINGQQSDYIASLEQYKLLSCQSINSYERESKEMDQWYSQYDLNSNAIALPHSNMIISCSNADNELNNRVEGPSHLMRLYNYHAVMKKAGHLLLQDSKQIPEVIYDMCDAAYIVSPVSSLIVLETQKDYERFDIDESVDSLKNANLKDSGAVPEPHEWALIAVVLAIFSFVYFKFK
ncbi:XrtN system VIT domain-containing protein [Carboxylicivirga sp. M1479]|uniref:XrtN system VIT domain-containing protein n=1 Tax=Carboxylicivirga sp. M1479 TaxID=2594476 RepID=UPI0011775ECB|nr:XrtN system VIT domain-containing protein [Carboxylicivirga sp. M1479]TRX70757.1 XrtN system VIT domain-containing protein [Carboxylicivirga sp. M1479]